MVSVALTHDDLDQGLATFSLLQAALAICVFVEGSRKKLIMSWTVSETVLF
jgi:hypothetical protein